MQERPRSAFAGTVGWPRVYDKTYAASFEPSVLDSAAGVLADLARGGLVLEFAVGTERVALALSARGIVAHGLELSPHRAARLSAKPGADFLKPQDPLPAF